MKPIALAVLAGLSRALLTQEPQTIEQVPVLSLSEIALEQHSVQHADPEELLDVATSLVGRYYYVREHGGRAGSPVQNLRQLGRTLIVYDTPDETKRALAVLARLDAAPTTDAPETRAAEYTPRFVSLETASDALKSFDPPGFKLSIVEERGLIVLRGQADRVTAALELLARVDVPEQQVLVTCTLLGADAAPDDPPPPKNLADNLAKLLPEHRFSQYAMALLQTSVGSDRLFSVGIETPGKFGAPVGDTYQFTFKPVAYDAKTGSLTVEKCQLKVVRAGVPTSDPPGDGIREIFTTNTTFRGGEYTVLAATGANPLLLLAVRVTPIGG